MLLTPLGVGVSAVSFISAIEMELFCGFLSEGLHRSRRSRGIVHCFAASLPWCIFMQLLLGRIFNMYNLSKKYS